MITPLTYFGDTPLFHAGGDGPTQGALIFRVGQWDEPLHWSGVTHLVEHVACAGLGHRMEGCNAVVEGLFTGFMATGSPEEVGEFLNSVSAMLRNPPVEHIDRERRVIGVEAQGTGMTPLDALLRERFGARGPGRSGYGELGLRRLSAGDLLAWAGTYFSGANAALVISGALPGDLRIRLPEGGRQAPPVPLQLPALAPGYEELRGYNGVAVSAVLPRSPTLDATLAILRRRLYDRLRGEHGLSYRVQVCADVIDASTSHVMIEADATSDGVGQARDLIIAEIDALAVHGAAAAELAGALADRARERSGNSTLLGTLDLVAREVLLGNPPIDHAERDREVANLAGGDIAAMAAKMLGSLLMLLPTRTGVDDVRFSRTSQWSTDTVAGTALSLDRPADDQRAYRLIVGAEGMTLVVGAGRVVTVRFSECVAVLHAPEHRFVLIGTDNFHLSFDAGQWTGGDAATRAVRDQVPEDRFIPMDNLPGATLRTGAIRPPAATHGAGV